MGEIRLEGLVARNSIRQVGEEEQHSHSAGLQGGGVPGQLLQAGLSPAAGFRRLPDVHQHPDTTGRLMAMTVRSSGVVRWMKLAASSGFYAGDRTRRVASSGCPWALAFRMSGMKAPAIMQAMPSSRLLMLTVISFPDPGGRGCT